MTTANEIQFEKSLARLEKIVEELETGNISLDEALKKYEEGIKLSRGCQEKLAQAEKKIEILSKSLNGSFKKEPFVFEEGGEGEGPERSAKKNAKASTREVKKEKEETGDEDLLF